MENLNYILFGIGVLICCLPAVYALGFIKGRQQGFEVAIDILKEEQRRVESFDI